MKMNYLSHSRVANTTVLVRVDFNAPTSNGKVTNNYKILSSIPTIRFLLKRECKVILATHLGRPKGRVIPSLKTDIIVKELQKHFSKNKVIKVDDCIGREVKEVIENSDPQEIILLENLRFYDGEKRDSSFFAKSLSRLANVYVNDAFGMSHRRHASVHAITKYLPSFAGLLLEKELFYLRKALKPKRPSVWILGGAKLDKVGIIEQALKKADIVLIGGALVFSFLKAKGFDVGMSLIDSKSVRVAKKILRQKSASKIVLANDFIASTTTSPQSKVYHVNDNELRGLMGLDIGPNSLRVFAHYLHHAKTIVWNGPLGYFESNTYANSTKEVARLLGKLNDVVTICGGGETSAALFKYNLENEVTHLSTGGGATLVFLEQRKLPVLEAMKKSLRRR